MDKLMQRLENLSISIGQLNPSEGEDSNRDDETIAADDGGATPVRNGQNTVPPPPPPNADQAKPASGLVGDAVTAVEKTMMAS